MHPYPSIFPEGPQPQSGQQQRARGTLQVQVGQIRPTRGIQESGSASLHLSAEPALTSLGSSKPRSQPLKSSDRLGAIGPEPC